MKRNYLLTVMILLLAVLALTACQNDDATTPDTTSSLLPAVTTSVADTSDAVTEEERVFVLDNDRLCMKLVYRDGSIALSSLYNKAANKEYLSSNSGHLFSYTVASYQGGVCRDGMTVTADDGTWTYVSTEKSDIAISLAESKKKVGTATEIVLRHDQAGLEVTLVFELYEDNGGLRYQAFLKNLRDTMIVITDSDVLSLSLAEDPHTLHYISAESSAQDSNIAVNSSWKSTTGALDANTGRNALCVYDSADGWWMMPETNWRTQLGPEVKGSKPSETSATFEFATTSCWATDGTVKVSVNPASLMLTLRPKEEFEYIGVNLTLFVGDVVDGKMAAEEHFYKRFLYHDTATIINTNDWYYLNKRTEEYFREVVIPYAKAAGIDMVMLDDLWNTNRDSITAISALGSLASFSESVKSEGFLLGLWYSMSGGDHNNGRDLADPAALAEKIAMVETLIRDYGMNHMMVDLTEYWQNTEETAYSAPCDNVYRKNVMVQNALNLLIEKYPDFYVKPTNEVDVYPTQGNRSNGLLHVMNNGWVVGNGGLGNGMYGLVNMFGYLPLSATYGDGNVDGDIAEYYYYLFCRNVKLPYAPDSDAWTEDGIALMAMLNTWRRATRVNELMSGIKRPSYLGEGWDGEDQEAWIEKGAKSGPYAWTYVNADKTRALLIATTAGNERKNFKADLRWLDASKSYLVADVSLHENGYFDYAFVGVYQGNDLLENGFSILLKDEKVDGKAFWFEAVEEGVAVVYASEAVKEYALSAEEEGYTLTVSGEAGEVAVVIVGDTVSKKGSVFYMIIGENGIGSVYFRKSDLLVPDATKSPFTTENVTVNSGLLELETLFAEGKLGYSDSSIKVNSKADDASGVGASNNDYRKIEFPKGAGSYITVPITVADAGDYTITVSMKSNENQAKAAIAHKGVLVSDTVDFSANVTLNTIYRLSCTVSLEAGENEIAIVCVGKGAGNTANVLSLRIDCITYTRMEDKSKTMEGEAHPEWGDVLANGLASSERAIRLDSNGLGAYTDIPLGLPEGVYAITLAWIKTASSPVIAILHDDVAIVEAYDLYAATDKRDTVTLTVRVKGESDHLRILTVGQKKASAGYDVILDCLSVCEKTPLSSKAFGVTVKIGEKINLAEQYTSEDNLVFVNCGETSRNVIKLSGCVLSAEKAGTALVKAYHPVTGEFAELLVTVVDHETPKEILTALDAINASDLTLACSLYEGLSEEAKAFVISYRFLMKTKQIKDEEEEDRLSDIYYLDEMAYTVNEGSTVKKGSCPSGSHEMKFSDSHSAYEHGLGFEPTTDEVGILYVAIPENATVFHAVIGLDHEMSKDGYSYDQQNTVKIWIDGVLWGSTDRILKNTQNGTWKDCTTTFDIEIPEGSSYLVIENDCGVNRICDHILYADACFLAR